MTVAKTLRGRKSICLAALLALAIGSSAVGTAFAADSAVVFMYHRFGEDDYPSTSVSLDLFAEHIAEFAKPRYNVRPLPDIVSAFRRREALPDRTLALTVDDAFLSVYREAWPRLRQAGLPFTLFVSTEPLDAGRPGYMTWDQVREMVAAGVTIGHHTASHAHLPDLDEARAREQIARASARFVDELGFSPTLFAYPYGEFGARERELAIEAGFEAAFGQHSGVAHDREDLYGLPRFALNQQFGTLQRLRLAAGALPLPVREVAPADWVLRDNNPPAFGFTVDKSIGDTGRLNCFASNQTGAARLERLGPQRIEVRLDQPFRPGRGRINCTLPAGPRWRWYGAQFYVPQP